MKRAEDQPEDRYFKLNDVGILPHPVQQAGIPIWIAADRNETGLKRVARLGDGWVTLAPTLERFTGAREKIHRYSEECNRTGKLRAATLYATFNILRDAARPRTKVGSFFRQPRAKLGHHFTIFGTPEECVRLLQGYVDAGLTTIIARVVSDGVRGQARMLLNEIHPALAV